MTVVNVSALGTVASVVTSPLPISSASALLTAARISERVNSTRIKWTGCGEFVNLRFYFRRFMANLPGVKKGVLLVNLGSPDSPSVPDVRRYLNEFLMDGRVIDAPWLVRRFVVGMILINRPRESAHAYEKVWTKEGSPLVVTSRHVQELLQKRVSLPVELAMRYQNPSIESGVKKLADQGATDMVLLPLCPHYAMSIHDNTGHD